MPISYLVFEINILPKKFYPSVQEKNIEVFNKQNCSSTILFKCKIHGNHYTESDQHGKSSWIISLTPPIRQNQLNSQSLIVYSTQTLLLILKKMHLKKLEKKKQARFCGQTDQNLIKVILWPLFVESTKRPVCGRKKVFS